MKTNSMNDVCIGDLQITDAISYLKAVKETFKNERGRYDMFIAIVKDFKTQRIDVADFLGKMKEVLEGHDFLILGLNNFLPRGYEIPPSFAQHLNVHNVDKYEIKAKKKQRKKPLTNYEKNNVYQIQKYDNKNDMHKKHKMDEIKDDGEADNKKSYYLLSRELDLSKCERYNINYVRLPKDYHGPIASERSKLDASVLNDHFVLDPQGDQDYSKSKKMCNKYQQALFRIEDEQFEVDMLLGSLSSACGRFKEVYQNVLENKINVKDRLHIEEYFSVSHLRLIERMYGEHGLDALEELRNNPTITLPNMLKHLEEKYEQMRQSRLEFNKVWAQDYADNHAKSLDHFSS